VLLELKHFRFAGEFRHVETLLTSLCAAVAQVALPPGVAGAVLSEVDTSHRLLRLTATVEDAARFLGQAGRLAGLDPDQTLDAFVLKVLGADPAEWAAAAPGAVRQRVALKHLAALYRCLEAAATGHGEDAFLDRVPATYLAALGGAQEQDLRARAARWEDPERVIAGVKGLIKNGTDAQSGYGAGHSLRDMLGCVDFLDEDGDDKWFFEGFPSGLEMRHIVAVYRCITSHDCETEGGHRS